MLNEMKSRLLSGKKLTITLSFFLIIVFFAFAQGIPQKIAYQGRLLENDAPVNGTKNFVFSFPGTAWSETHNNVPVTNGLYSVQLGAITPIPYTLFTENNTVPLQITVEGTTLSPQTEILSVAYAFKAENATKADQLGDAVFVANEGQVGIGTANPTAKLDISGSSGSYPDNKALRVLINSEGGSFNDQISINCELDSTKGYGIAFTGLDHHRGGIYAKNRGGENSEKGEVTLWSRSGVILS